MKRPLFYASLIVALLFHMNWVAAGMTTGVKNRAGFVTLTMSVERWVCTQGEPIRVRISLVNKGTEAVRLPEPSPGSWCTSFVLDRTEGGETWLIPEKTIKRRNGNNGATLLKPGQIVTSGWWTLPVELPPGDYTMRAIYDSRLAVDRIPQLWRGRAQSRVQNFFVAARGDTKTRDYMKHMYAGLHYSRTGRYKEAVREYTAAITLRPRSSGAHFGLARALADLRDVEHAIQEFETCIRLNPEGSSMARLELELLKKGVLPHSTREPGQGKPKVEAPGDGGG
jgi:hypothetical protein